jgi:hypothetical protein
MSIASAPEAARFSSKPGKSLSRILCVREKHVEVPRLRDALSKTRLFGEAIPFDDGDLIEAVGEDAGGQKPGHAPADDDGLFCFGGHESPFGEVSAFHVPARRGADFRRGRGREHEAC